MNRLRLTAYSSGTTTVPDAKLERAQSIRFSTIYPGGLDAELSFYVPVKATAVWGVKENHRIVVRSGFTIIWEGKVTSITPDTTPGIAGLQVVCMGYWATVAMRQMVLKPWADTRLEEDAWFNPGVFSGHVPDKCGIDRQNRIRFTPKSIRDAAGAEVGWSANQYAALEYAAPTGQTIKRITYNYDLQEGAQNWNLVLYDIVGSVDLDNKTASGTGSVDHTLATPRSRIWIALRSGANQSPATDGTMYAEFSSITVYTETGAIDGQQVAIDLAGYTSELSTDTSKIGALTYSLVPFISMPAEYIADLLARATKYGDSSNNLWAAYIGRSDRFTDSKPGLVLEQQPALTDYDYSISLGAPNVGAGAQFSRDTSEIRNYFFVDYTDEAGVQRHLSPEDDATLTDATSSGLYGRADELVDVDTTSSTNAKQYAKTLLAARADLQWKATASIPILGYIHSKAGVRIPACEIRAGMRVKVRNFFQDLSGTGLTFLITATQYEHDTRTNMLSIGLPDGNEAYFAREFGDL